MAIGDITIQNNMVYEEGLNSVQRHVGYAMIPEGGTTGQALVKSSDEDYAIGWGNTSGGGGDYNIDGGKADSVYTAPQLLDGGGA